jgi:hypothetical protein
MNMNLRELYLADNKLNGLQDSAQLGNLLKFNCSLQILDLRNNHVLDSGACLLLLCTSLPSTSCAQPCAKVGSAKYSHELSQYCPPEFTDGWQGCATSDSSHRSLHRRVSPRAGARSQDLASRCL